MCVFMFELYLPSTAMSSYLYIVKYEFPLVIQAFLKVDKFAGWVVVASYIFQSWYATICLLTYDEVTLDAERCFLGPRAGCLQRF